MPNLQRGERVKPLVRAVAERGMAAVALTPNVRRARYRRWPSTQNTRGRYSLYP